MQLASLFTKFGKGAASKQLYIYETWARWAARALQFVFALVVIGLYGNRVDHDRKAGDPQSPAWVYAVVVAGLSCVTCVIYAIPLPFLKIHRLFAWDLLLFILWIAVFGVFAGLFLKNTDDEYQGTSVKVMKNAVWIDLVNCIFWLLTGLWGCFRTFVGRKVDGSINRGLGSIESKVSGKVFGQQTV